MGQQEEVQQERELLGAAGRFHAAVLDRLLQAVIL
jgi:hypothetical protein